MRRKSSDKSDKLSPLGKALESSLKRLIGDLDSKGDGSDPKYSLLDKLRVYDRALKLEQIKHRIQDEEGGFFGGQPKGGAEDE
jgi:hypothetical protein